jgi:YVTN family beta-propeller protein
MIKKLKSIYAVLFILFSSSVFGAVIDRSVTTITVGPTPSGIAITPDGRFAYVANNNNNGAPGYDSISVINLQTNKVIKTIHDDSFNQPYLIAMNSKGSKIYVTNSNSTTVTVINIETNLVEAIIGGFDGPSGIVLTPDDTTAYVTNYGGPEGVQSGNGTTVRVVDLSSNAIVGPAITVDLAPADLAITPDGKLVYVINYRSGNPGTGTISVINTSSNTVVATLDAGLSGPYDIVMDSAGKYAYISNFGSNNFFPYGRTVSILDLSTNKIVDAIQVGIQPSGIAIAPNGRFLYVTNYYSLYDGFGYANLVFGVGTVSVIDLVTRKVVGKPLLVGASPAWIAIAPDGMRAYVVNYTSNNVTVLDINDQMWLYKKSH